MIVLKIIGWALLGLVALLLLICLASIKITVGIKDDFYWRLSVFGIPIPQSLLKGKKEKRRSESGKTRKGKRKAKGTSEEKGDSEEKKKKPIGDVLSLVFELCSEALKTAPKAFRIRLHRLNIKVGGEDAAGVALTYGGLYAILEGGLAFLDTYRGFLYGFRARRNKISLTVDYSGAPTKANFKLTVSCFVWQLLNVAVRLGIKYVLHTLERDNRETENSVPEKTSAPSDVRGKA